MKFYEFNLNGTSKIGSFECSPACLARAFTDFYPGDNFKVSREYYFFDSKGNCFCIYDWKLTHFYDKELPSCEEFWKSTEITTFSIGGKHVAQLEVTEFKKWLNATIVDKI